MQPQRQNPGKVRLGDLLVKAGVITEAQLRTALSEQRRFGGKLGDILVRMRYLSEDVFVRALAKQMNLPRADLSGNAPVAPEALARVPAAVAEEYEVVPCALLDEGKTIGIATSDPLNLTVQDAIRSVAQCRVVPYVAGASQIRAAIARLYGGDDAVASGPVDDGQLRILDNSEDMSATHAAANQSRGLPPPTPPPAPPAAPPVKLQPTPVPFVLSPAETTNPNFPGAFASPYPLPAYAYPPAPYPPAYAPPPVAPLVPPMPLADEGPRREAAAIKALVELLVQKGVITLDEYLARLKR